MAHSWITAFPSEFAAFRQFAEIYGDRSVILLDTYDTIAAARSVVAGGLAPSAVRLDSGDVIALSREVRAILDGGGLHRTQIFVSGDLDEWRIASIVEAGAPVDGFGVGAALSTSSDAPSLGAIYKLAEIERGGAPVPVMKRSPGKQTFPGRKQVWRVFEHGVAVEDIIDIEAAPGESMQAEPPSTVRPLLVPVMRGGRREHPPVPVADLRAQQLAEIARLPAAVRRLVDPARYRVRFGSALESAVKRFL